MEKIFNVAIDIDTERITELIEEDVKDRVIGIIAQDVENALIERYSRSIGTRQDKLKDACNALAHEIVSGEWIDKHSDEIIREAAQKVSMMLKNTKKYKQAVNDIEVKPMQEPLTLEETKIQLAVWVERLPRFEGECVAVRPETYSGEYRDELNYGKTWRCWLKKPTDEERKAAKWEV